MRQDGKEETMSNFRLRIEVLESAVDWEDRDVTSGVLRPVRPLAATPTATRLRLPGADLSGCSEPGTGLASTQPA